MNINTPFEKLSDVEKKVMYQQWQIFMKRHAAQRQRARLQRERNRAAIEYAKAKGFSAEDMEVGEEV